MPLEPLTPERRRELTRTHLLEAAAEVFREQGFHGATLDEVARRAGFTKGAVYSNFKNKDDLFLAVMDDRIERQFAVTAEVLGSGSHDEAAQRARVEGLLHSRDFGWDEDRGALFLEFVLYARRNPEAAEKLADSYRRARQMTVDLIAAEIAAGGTPAQRPYEQIALFSQALFEGLGILRLIDPAVVPDDMMDTVLGFLYDSM
jgi:AcrR family transcriptional regulator